MDSAKLEKLSKSFDLVLRNILEQLYGGKLKCVETGSSKNLQKIKDQKYMVNLFANFVWQRVLTQISHLYFQLSFEIKSLAKQVCVLLLSGPANMLNANIYSTALELF